MCVSRNTLGNALLPAQERDRKATQTFLLVVRLLLPTPAQALQRPCHLAAKLILPGAGLCPPRRLLLLLVLVVVQDGGLSDGHPNDGVVGLQARVAEVLPGLGAQQHRGDVVDLVGGLGAGALLRDAAALVPAPLGVQGHHEHQQQQQQRDQPALQRHQRAPSGSTEGTWGAAVPTESQNDGWMRNKTQLIPLPSTTATSL